MSDPVWPTWLWQCLQIWHIWLQTQYILIYWTSRAIVGTNLDTLTPRLKYFLNLWITTTYPYPPLNSVTANKSFNHNQASNFFSLNPIIQLKFKNEKLTNLLNLHIQINSFWNPIFFFFHSRAWPYCSLNLVWKLKS